MPVVMDAIKNMNTREKVQTMDLLWTALEASADEYTPPDWHREELERRERLYRAGKIETYDWAEVRERLDARRVAVSA